MKFSAITLLLSGGLGFVLGTVLTQRHPHVALAQVAVTPTQAPSDGKLRIIIFGAHPDDAEYRGAGVAMKWAKARPPREARLGDQWRYRPLGIGRRTAGDAPKEGSDGSRPRLGVTTEVLDIHDGEILPTLENRRTDHAPDP